MKVLKYAAIQISQHLSQHEIDDSHLNGYPEKLNSKSER